MLPTEEILILTCRAPRRNLPHSTFTCTGLFEGVEKVHVMDAIAMVNGLEITVIYVDLDTDERRTISAWRSEPHERREYWKVSRG